MPSRDESLSQLRETLRTRVTARKSERDEMAVRAKGKGTPRAERSEAIMGAITLERANIRDLLAASLVDRVINEASEAAQPTVDAFIEIIAGGAASLTDAKEQAEAAAKADPAVKGGLLREWLGEWWQPETGRHARAAKKQLEQAVFGKLERDTAKS